MVAETVAVATRGTDWAGREPWTGLSRHRQDQWGWLADADKLPELPGLLASVAHELRAPLASLATSSELLLEDFEVLDPPQMQQMVSAIHRGALWLQNLVENLLLASTVREGRFQIQLQQINLLEVVTEIQPVVEPLLRRKGQPFRFSVRGALPDVLADDRRIGQVLINLVLNASKFAPDRTPIDVVLTAQRHGVRVTVSDRGPGIPVGSEERLFGAFYQAPNGARSGNSGVGLGLAIVRWIVEAHHGQVGAENRRGSGARFWFELPAATDSSLPGRRPVTVGVGQS